MYAQVWIYPQWLIQPMVELNGRAPLDITSSPIPRCLHVCMVCLYKKVLGLISDDFGIHCIKVRCAAIYVERI